MECPVLAREADFAFAMLDFRKVNQSPNFSFRLLTALSKRQDIMAAGRQHRHRPTRHEREWVPESSLGTRVSCAKAGDPMTHKKPPRRLVVFPWVTARRAGPNDLPH
jgi:hypothetical protein